jgi:hypothetical protein
MGAHSELVEESLENRSRIGIGPVLPEAAFVLPAAQKLSRGRRINETALIRTSSVFKQSGFPLYPKTSGFCRMQRWHK